MDASQYKDYVLVLLFIKYVSDKYAGQPYAQITVPKGASFKDRVALKGNPRIWVPGTATAMVRVAMHSSSSIRLATLSAYLGEKISETISIEPRRRGNG
jgi:hypothetical protein